jgi:hypothetical protein
LIAAVLAPHLFHGLAILAPSDPGEPVNFAAPVRIAVITTSRIARASIAWRIGVISACAVVVWGRHRRTDGRGTDGSGADTHGYARAHIGAAISAATINAANASTAAVVSAHAGSAAPIRQGFSRNTRDAKDGSGSNGNDSSTGHGFSFRQSNVGICEAQYQRTDCSKLLTRRNNLEPFRPHGLMQIKGGEEL